MEVAEKPSLPHIDCISLLAAELWRVNNSSSTVLYAEMTASCSVAEVRALGRNDRVSAINILPPQHM